MGKAYENLNTTYSFNVKMGSEDDLEVISRAVRKYLERKSGKLLIGKQELCKQLAEMIEDGFLEDIKKNRETFAAINSAKFDAQLRAYERSVANVSDLIKQRNEIEDQIQSMKNALEDIEEKIKAHDGKIIEQDGALTGAKKAYQFILNETHDKDKACKAYNSYLLRGINDGGPEKVNADEVIKDAKQGGLSEYFWKGVEVEKPIRRRF